MKLVKACRAEHNVRNGSRIQLGTLSYYRQISKEELRDEGEGTHEITLDIHENCKIPTPIFNAIGGGALVIGHPDSQEIFPYLAQAKLDRVRIASTSTTHVEIESAKALIERRHPDGWIFCMSMLEQTDEKIFDGYDDKWSIPYVNAQKFADAIADAFAKQLHLKENYTTWLPPVFASDLQGNGKLDAFIEVQHMPVLYGDRTFEIRNDDPAILKRALDQVTNMAFTKPPSFSQEREYRFLLTVHARADHMPPGIYKTYPPASDTVLLEVNFDWDVT